MSKKFNIRCFFVTTRPPNQLLVILTIIYTIC